MEEKSGGKKGKEERNYRNFRTGMPQESRSHLSASGRRQPRQSGQSILLFCLLSPVLAVWSPVPWYETNTKPSLCNINTDDVLVLEIFSMFCRLFHFEKIPGAFKVGFVFFLQMIMKVEQIY